MFKSISCLGLWAFSAILFVAPVSMAQTDGATAAEPAIDFDVYASLRLQANFASVDEAAPGQDTSYLGLSDAYSRAGAKATYKNEAFTLTANVEVNLNTADLEIGDPSFFDDEEMRLYSVTASGDWGSVRVGKDWLPYYNNVGYPVDYFSSLYAGYTTYAFFRERQIAYTTPQMGGVTGTVARIERTGDGPRGWHYAANYSADGLTLAAGMEDMDGDVANTYGAAVSYSSDDWYGALKYEHTDPVGDIYNAFGQYTSGKFTYKAGIGLGDQFSGDTFHVGVDYKATDTLKLFGEIYSEQRNYALLADGAEQASDYLGAGGFGAEQQGKALVFGVRYDIST